MWQQMFSMPVMRTVWRRELTPPQLYEKVHELVWIKLNESKCTVKQRHSEMLYLQILPFRKGTSLDYILIEVLQFLHFFFYCFTSRILMYYFQHVIEHQHVTVSNEVIH